MKALIVTLILLCSTTLTAQIVASPNPVDGHQGQSYSHTFTATGGTGTYISYAIVPASSIPPGLSLNASTGELSGTFPSGISGNSYLFNVRVTDNVAATGDTQMTLNISSGTSSSSDDGGGGCVAAEGEETNPWTLGGIIAFILSVIGLAARSKLISKKREAELKQQVTDLQKKLENVNQSG